MQSENTESRRLLFVCAGNTCRSPMAKALAVRLFGDNVYVESVGIDTASGLYATPEAIQVLAEEGIDLSSHRSLNISELKFSQWDIIVAMTPRIAANIVASNIISAEHLIEWNVVDPYGQGIEAYRRCITTLSKLLPNLSDLLQTETPQNFSLNYLSQANQHQLQLKEYVSNRIARIESNEIVDRSHLEGIATSALREFELILRFEMNRILQKHRLNYKAHICPYIEGNPPFKVLTLGKLIKCYETLINKYRIKPQVEFRKGDMKIIDFKLLEQMYRINERRAELIHKRAITKDKTVKLLKDISSAIN